MSMEQEDCLNKSKKPPAIPPKPQRFAKSNFLESTNLSSPGFSEQIKSIESQDVTNTSRDYKKNQNLEVVKQLSGYTPKELLEILLTARSKTPLGLEEFKYLMEFLKILTQQDKETRYDNLKILYNEGAFHEDSLWVILNILFESHIKWTIKEKSSLIASLFRLKFVEPFQSHLEELHPQDFDPLQLYRKLNNCEKEALKNCWIFIYIYRFLESLNMLEDDELEEYFKILRNQAVLNPNNLQDLFNFNWKWKPHNWEQLAKGLTREMENFRIHGHLNKKRKWRNYIPKSSKYETVVHHHNTQAFQHVMDYLLKDGPLNDKRLGVLEEFLENLTTMNDEEEIWQYLNTLKRRQAFSDNACLYLINLLHKNMVLESVNIRQHLLQILCQFIDYKKPLGSLHKFPSITKYLKLQNSIQSFGSKNSQYSKGVSTRSNKLKLDETKNLEGSQKFLKITRYEEPSVIREYKNSLSPMVKFKFKRIVRLMKIAKRFIELLRFYTKRFKA